MEMITLMRWTLSSRDSCLPSLSGIEIVGGSDWQVNMISWEVLVSGSAMPELPSSCMVSNKGPGSEAVLKSPEIPAAGVAAGRDDRGTSAAS